MKKVINLTIGGVVFSVEEDAYEALADYLNGIKKHFAKDKAADEILEDIEAGIAEKLQKRKSTGTAVTQKELDSITKQMGTLADFKKIGEEEEEEEKRKLYRDPEDEILAGVCSGLAAYFGIETVLMRLIFFTSIFFGGAGIIIYFILWLVMPVAESTTQKLEMRGERITLYEIEKSVKRGVQNLKKKDLSDFKKGMGDLKGFFEFLFEASGKLFWILLKILRVVVALGLIAVAILGIFAVSFAFHLDDFSLYSPALSWAFFPAFYLSAFIPMLLFLLLGINLLKKKPLIPSTIFILLLVLWFASLGITGADIFQNPETIKDHALYFEHTVERWNQ